MLGLNRYSTKFILQIWISVNSCTLLSRIWIRNELTCYPWIFLTNWNWNFVFTTHFLIFPSRFFPISSFSLNHVKCQTKQEAVEGNRSKILCGEEEKVMKIGMGQFQSPPPHFWHDTFVYPLLNVTHEETRASLTPFSPTLGG